MARSIMPLRVAPKRRRKGCRGEHPQWHRTSCRVALASSTATENLRVKMRTPSQSNAQKQQNLFWPVIAYRTVLTQERAPTTTWSFGCIPWCGPNARRRQNNGFGFGDGHLGGGGRERECAS